MSGLTKTERTKALIIEKSAEIFNKKGFAGTSLTDLIEATGLSKGSIYGNFENKEAVALAVFDYNYERLKKATNLETAKAITFHDKVMVYAKVYRKITKGGFTSGGCPILNTAIEADDTNILLKSKAAAALKYWCTGISSLIEKGKDAGEFKVNTDARKTAVSIVALIEGGVMMAKVTDNLYPIDLILETVEELVTRIIVQK